MWTDYREQLDWGWGECVHCPVSPLSGHNIVISDDSLETTEHLQPGLQTKTIHNFYMRPDREHNQRVETKKVVGLYRDIKPNTEGWIIEFIVWIFPKEQGIIWRGLPEYSVFVENECLFIIL